jgi:ribosomal protein L16 Arg81 hydroxylase
LFDQAAFYRGAPDCFDLKVGYTDERGWPAHFNIKPSQIKEMLDSGKTVCASAINTGNPILTSFLDRVGKQFALLGRFFFNSYLSPDGAGFGLHLDHHPVMILQIEGRKRWWYSPEPALREVLSNISFPHGRDVLQLPWVTITRPAEASLREVILNPGDILYMPKGTWHRAQAIGGSLGLTLAMESASPLDLLQHALGPHLNRIELRNALPGYWEQSIQDQMPAELKAAFDCALSSLRSALNSVTPEELFRLWRQAQTAQSAVKK